MQPDEQNNYWQNDQNRSVPQSNIPATQPLNNQPSPQQAFQTPIQSTPQPYARPVQQVASTVQPVPQPAQIQEMYTPTPNVEPPVPIIENVTPVIENSPIHWSANEYIYREKNRLWFVIFAIVILILIAGDIFFLRSYTFSALVVVMAISVVVFSRRPPRTIDYALSDDHGLYIGEKLYHFSEFKAFGILQEEGYNSIILIPIKRFLPGVSVYFPQEVGEKIVDIFGARLPMETAKLDVIDIIVRKLRL